MVPQHERPAWFMYLTKDSILKSEDRKYQDIEIPEWGGTVRVQSLTGAERLTFDMLRARLTPAHVPE